jgi:hypothetical protein
MTFVNVLTLLYLKSLAEGHAYRYVQFHQLRPCIKRIREQKVECKERGLRLDIYDNASSRGRIVYLGYAEEEPEGIQKALQETC